jgi:ATP-dependent helicase/nuclease subunit B
MPAIEIPSQAMQARLRGFVDRVDIWQSENASFFRVVDYKTGKKTFDYCDILNGVGLQMLLYLFALEDAGGELISGDRISAGVQYFPARAPYVNVDGSMTVEEAEAERRKLWKRSGLLLSNEDSLNAMDPSEKLDTLCCSRKKDGTITGDLADRVQLGMLKDYVMTLLGNMVDEIASGNVSPNPYTRGTSHNACSFCPYGAICRKETVADRRNYKTVTAQRFWEEIGKEEDRG